MNIFSQYLYPRWISRPAASNCCIRVSSRDHKWLCADRISYLGTTVQEGIILIERATGRSKMIASTGHCKTGADHQHPSFNRRGDQILFSNPDKNGTAQVCLIDLHQVWQDW